MYTNHQTKNVLGKRISLKQKWEYVFYKEVDDNLNSTGFQWEAQRTTEGKSGAFLKLNQQFNP